MPTSPEGRDSDDLPVLSLWITDFRTPVQLAQPLNARHRSVDLDSAHVDVTLRERQCQFAAAGSNLYGTPRPP